MSFFPPCVFSVSQTLLFGSEYLKKTKTKTNTWKQNGCQDLMEYRRFLWSEISVMFSLCWVKSSVEIQQTETNKNLWPLPHCSQLLLTMNNLQKVYTKTFQFQLSHECLCLFAKFKNTSGLWLNSPLNLLHRKPLLWINVTQNIPVTNHDASPRAADSGTQQVQFWSACPRPVTVCSFALIYPRISCNQGSQSLRKAQDSYL